MNPRFADLHPFRTLLLALLVLALLPTGAGAVPRANEDDPESAARIIDAVRGSLVRVEHHLRQYQGERPDIPVSGDPFAIAGGGPRESADALIGDERPLESGGFLLEPTLVLAMDIPLHERFVDRIVVRHGADSVAGVVESWAIDDVAVFLRLERPLEGAATLTLAEPGTDATWSVRWLRAEGSWVAEARPFQSRVSRVEDVDGGAWRIATAAGTLMLDDVGRLVGATVRGSHPRERGLVGDPRLWPRLDRAERAALLERAAVRADATILRATLQFRSPRQRGGPGRFSPYREDGDGVGTELQTLAVRLDDGRAVVLAALPPSATARLESISLIDADAIAHAAQFESTLRDIGALIVRSESVAGLGDGLRLSTAGALAWRDRLLPTALIRIAGRQRVRETGHIRLERFAVGWRGHAYPVLVPEVDRTFVLSGDGELVALPMARRISVSDRERWRNADWMAMPASVLAAALSDGTSATDPSNIPLDEASEARSAWLGVIMQGLEPDLADALGVAELTMAGQFGGLVTAVFEGSPAARAGIAPGAVVLAIHAASRPRPIQIVVDETDMGYPGAFPWDRLDEVPEELFDQIPTPWPTIEDLTSTVLAEIGFGSEFELEIFVDGETRRIPMTVERSPPHFGNAPRHEEERLGLTVQDLSFEVRSHLRIGADEPGVVISALKAGGRASRAGLRPFEIIVEVDGEPVADAAAFGARVEGKSDLRLAVRRGTRSRVVRLAD